MSIVELLRVAAMWLLFCLIAEILSKMFFTWNALPAAVVLCGVLIASRK